jgi:hypothetical protein
MFFNIPFGSIAQQKYVTTAPPGSDILVNNITTTRVGSEILVTYTTTGEPQKNQLPIATGVQLIGLPNVGEELNAIWTYFHINNASEGSTEIEIQTAVDEAFTTDVQVVGASTPYVVDIADLGRYIRVAITPVTSDGTSGAQVFSSASLVSSSLTQKQIRISLGQAAKAFSNVAWNLAHTDNPDASYELANIKNSDGDVITGLNLDVDLAMSDNVTGPSNAGIDDAAEFIAGSCAGYWYPASGTRGFIIEVPGGGLGVGTGEVKICGAITSGTNAGSYSVNGTTINLPNVTATTPDSDNVAFFENVDMSGNITIRCIDGTGICPINALIIYYYE